MSIVIENEINFNFNFDYESIIIRVIEYALEYIDCPYEVEINCTLTSNELIREINKDFRNIDQPTDVLSFPLIDYEAPGNFSFVEQRVEDYFNPDTGELMLGDLVISCDKVLEQSKQYDHTELRELAFLIAHGMFHLFGFDHIEEEERKIMEEKQKELLYQLEIYR